MSDKENSFDLARSLQSLIKSNMRGYVLIDGVIELVNDNFTCDIKVQDVVFSDVPVAVLINSQADFYAKPKVGSKCLITFRDGNINFPQLVQCDQVELFIFNQGTLGGMVKVIDLVERLNKVESKVNTILDTLKGIAIPSTPYPFGTQFTAISDLVETTRADIENTKITQ